MCIFSTLQWLEVQSTLEAWSVSTHKRSFPKPLEELGTENGLAESATHPHAQCHASLGRHQGNLRHPSRMLPCCTVQITACHPL